MLKPYGIIKNLFSDATLQEWYDIFMKIPTITKTEDGDNCWGLDINSRFYSWFQKKMMPHIQEHLGKDLKLIFCSYIDSKHPLPIHDDLKKLPNGAIGSHAFSILIPYSVENAKDSFSKVGTCFYDKDKKIIENLAWDKGSMVWWKSSTLHSSSDFVKEGVKSKQYFVAHTYV